MKIRIYNVGRDKRSSVIEVADDCEREWVASAILREVRRMKAIMSRGIEVYWNPELRSGTVYAGDRAVGSCEVVP